MKTLIIYLILGICSFGTMSCSEEEPITAIKDCTTDYSQHADAASFQSLIDGYTTDGFVGMTLLIDSPQKGLWMGSSGFANLEKQTRMNPCNIHHTASLYKTYIATVIMQLVNEDKINLDDKLSEYITSDITNQIPNGKQVSIKNLLQHRSGIPDIFEMEFLTNFFNNPMKSYSIDELLGYVYNKEPLSEAGTAFYYSDANYTLLSLVVEAIEGSYVQTIRSRIFKPLALEHTYFLEDPTQAPDKLADSYWYSLQDGNLENNSSVQTTLTAGLPGSDGIITSANELKIFIQALVNGDLGADLLSMTDFVEVPVEVQQTRVFSSYGIGLMKVNIGGDDWYGHFGNQIGAGAIVLYNSKKDITMVALQNTGTFFSADIQSKFFYQLLRDVEAIIT